MTDLVEVVMVALAERDGSVSITEARAGRALRQWTDAEGQTIAEFVAWCGGALTTREAARLRRLAADTEQPPVEPRRAQGSRERGTGADLGEP